MGNKQLTSWCLTCILSCTLCRQKSDLWVQDASFICIIVQVAGVETDVHELLLSDRLYLFYSVIFLFCSHGRLVSMRWIQGGVQFNEQVKYVPCGRREAFCSSVGRARLGPFRVFGACVRVCVSEAEGDPLSPQGCIITWIIRPGQPEKERKQDSNSSEFKRTSVWIIRAFKNTHTHTHRIISVLS